MAGCASDLVGLGPFLQASVPPDADFIMPFSFISSLLLVSFEIKNSGSGSMITPMFFDSLARTALLVASSSTEYKPSVFVDMILAPSRVCA